MDKRGEFLVEKLSSACELTQNQTKEASPPDHGDLGVELRCRMVNAAVVPATP
jgi:hypothetical protein